MKSFKLFLEDYMDIGHLGADNYAWTWVKKTGKLTSKKGSHGQWVSAKPFNWSGRYDPETNFVSVVPKQKPNVIALHRPSLRIPLELKRALKKEYGDDIVFKPFDGSR